MSPKDQKKKALNEDYLVTLYEASDEAISRLSGTVDVDSYEEIEDVDGSGLVIDSEPIAKLHRKIMLLGKGIGVQTAKLNELSSENDDLRNQIGTSSGDDGRQLAEMLAAAAVPPGCW